MKALSSGDMPSPFADSSTIGQEKYAPPTDGNMPISRGIDIITKRFFLSTPRMVSDIRLRTSFSLRSISSIRINVRAAVSSIVTTDVMEPYMVLSILAGVIRYSKHTSAEAANSTYPTPYFLRISSTISVKVSAIFAMSYMQSPPMQTGHNRLGLSSLKS
ncbi:hypothetical protein MBAV_001507 [Candidatus Magnetobacterium bavaricum]|uniref:Uncharacterized protein n=1 Tax=Candidatus Magnetobacterium bavaricum TaxID=29290 RepID=A0A0F3GWH1_9BACT|nr:hypothetical protein MBAV_001507 [Candidatus Magnetobacterium bavaricum]